MFNSRIKSRDVFQKLKWLEFENESILKYLTKYDVIISKTNNSENIPEVAKLQDFVDLTHEEEFYMMM
jgi:hypothetical protein